jgi:flavin-dependent dehydrogenase
MNIAGAHVNARSMHLFLHSRAPQSVLPNLESAQGSGDLAFFKGRFPISVAQAISGDRYVIVGDAAGLVRPFKGKGVNSALQTGSWAARTMMTAGISDRAFHKYHADCCDITDDMPYGRTIRLLTIALSKSRLFDIVIALAEQDPILRHALFDAVSAHRTYHAIVQRTVSPRWMARMAVLLAQLPFRWRTGQLGTGDPS